MTTTTTNSTGAYEGLDEKIDAIRSFYSQSHSHPDVRALAESISFTGGRLDITGFFNRLKSFTRYIPDPTDAELIKAPWIMVEEIHDRGFSAGDCDDLASLAYAVLHAVGVPAKLRVAWYGGAKNPSHIFVVIPQTNGSMMAFDLVANAYGQTKAGATKTQDYA